MGRKVGLDCLGHGLGDLREICDWREIGPLLLAWLFIEQPSARNCAGVP
jgi:hypothetical protein